MTGNNKNVKTLGEKFPELIPYWDYEKNDKTPFFYLPSSHKSVYWNFPNLRDKLEIRIVTMRPDRYINYGVGSVGLHPVLRFFYSKNNRREALDVPTSSKNPVLWEDSFGNKYKTCPKVAEKNIINVGDNLKDIFSKKSISDEKPELVRIMWDYSKNERDGIRPEDVSPHSKKEVWWVCPKYKISYKRKVSLQNRSGLVSPYQTGSRCSPEDNSLLKVVPDVESCWSEKNSLSPDELTPGSQYRATLVDEITGEEFERVVYDIPKYGFRKNWSIQQSRGERELSDWLISKNVNLLKNDRKKIYPYELDIYARQENSDRIQWRLLA